MYRHLNGADPGGVGVLAPFHKQKGEKKKKKKKIIKQKKSSATDADLQQMYLKY